MCRNQVLERIKSLAALVGRTPTSREMDAHGINREAARLYFGTVAKAIEICGLRARPSKGWKYTDAELLANIQSVVESRGRLPMRSDARRGLLPSHQVYDRRFGSWANAVKRAGYVPARKGQKWVMPQLLPKRKVATA